MPPLQGHTEIGNKLLYFKDLQNVYSIVCPTIGQFSQNEEENSIYPFEKTAISFGPSQKTRA